MFLRSIHSRRVPESAKTYLLGMGAIAGAIDFFASLTSRADFRLIGNPFTCDGHDLEIRPPYFRNRP